MIVKNEKRRVSPFPCFSLTHRSQFTSLRVAPHDTQSCVLCNQMREHEQVVPWCNWLALRTLNPAIRVQISVGPSFLPSFLFASVNHSLTIATHMRFGVTCVSVFPSMMQTRNPAISRFPFPQVLQSCSRLSIGDADWNWDDEWIVWEEVGERSRWIDTNAEFITSDRKRGCGNGRIACLHHAWKETHTSHSKSHV